jgi:hypothetical protein
MMDKKQRVKYHHYMSEEIEFLKKIAKGRSYLEINTLFNERFGLELTFNQIIGTLCRFGLRNGIRANRWSEKPGHCYTSEEIEFLKKETKKHSYAEIIALFNERFGVELDYDQVRGKIKRLGLRNYFYGTTHPAKSKKGYQPPQFIGQGFKPGHTLRSKPIGSEFIKCGYTSVKIDNKPHCETENWKLKHRVIWEKEHGPIPKGHVIIFADGNRSNCNLNNLLLVSRAELSVINQLGLISSDPELTKTGLLVARIKLLINKRERELKEGGATT